MNRGGGSKRDAIPGPSTSGSSSKDVKKSSPMQIIKEEDSSYACIFCKSCKIDSVKLGEMYTMEGVTTHYFCMLFSAALSQLGTDDEGILGFLPNDIMKEVRRSHKLKCVYCNVTGASVGCCQKKCRQAFHYRCGLENGANFRFLGNYESFCEEHANRQKITLKQKDWNCVICMSLVSRDQNPIMSTCCNAAVFHKDCLQILALNAGYFFRCPACNDTTKFVQTMRCLGIYVPEQDASWEKGNAFQDLYVQYAKCDAETCECPKGREYVSAKGSWLLARCRLCGASGTHRKCSNLETIVGWACIPCLTVEKKADELKNTQSSKSTPTKKPVKVNSEVTVVAGPSSSSMSDYNNENNHVSARSGNRCVRNGTYRTNQSPRTKWREESTDAWDFDMSQVKISPSCISYFPYSEDKLVSYKNASVLPDWRRLSLCVNIMKWLPFIPTQLSVPQRGFSQRSYTSKSKSVKQIKAKPLREANSNTTATNVPFRASGHSPIRKSLVPSRKKRKRGTRWCRGVSNPRSKKLRLAAKISRLEKKCKNSGSSKHEEEVSSTAETVTSKKLCDTMQEVEVIPITAQEKAESAFLSAIETGGEPPTPISQVRRRKQIFTSDPNRKYYEVKGSILEVYSTDSNEHGTQKFTSLLSSEDQLNGIENSNNGFSVAGQELKLNVEYDVEISLDGEQIRIDESENSWSPTTKSRNSNWKPINKPIVSSPKASSSGLSATALPSSSSATSNSSCGRQSIVDSMPGTSSELRKKSARTASQLGESLDVVKPSKRVARAEVNSITSEESTAPSSGRTDLGVVSPSRNTLPATSLLHESSRCVKMDHPYSGSLASTNDAKVLGDIKSFQPPEEWSRSAKSWNKEMMNKVLISSRWFSRSENKAAKLATVQIVNES